MSALEISSVTLKPVVEDMLRTRFCVPDSILVVEGVDVIPLTETGRWCTVRLLLSDNDFCIQALLDGALHRFIQTGEVTVGCYVRLQQFELRWRRVAEESDAEGNKMVYLILHDLVTVGWNRDICDLHKKTTAASLEPLLSEPDEPRQDIDDTESAIVKSRGHQKAPLISQKPHDMRAAHEAAKTEDINLVEAPEAFDAHVRLPRARMPAGAAGEQTTPRDWKDPQTPLKLTTLCSIPHLPYKQNWTCNVLAIVVSLSAVEASHLPPYKQRVARIADPSTNKLVHLTVLLDPEDFVPRIGSAVLLAGVKNHRFDGGSLKKYASDKKDRIKWWSEDPWELIWCDVTGIKRWWKEVEAAHPAT